MKKVDVVSGTYLNLPNGLSKFLYVLKKNRTSFKHQGIDLCVYTNDCINSISYSSSNLKKRELLKGFLLGLAKRSYILTYLMVSRTMLKHSKAIARYYLNLHQKADLVVFQDLFSCYYYLQYKKNKQKVFLTMHNKGDMWEMIASSYPLLLKPLFKHFRNKVETKILNTVDRVGFVSKTSKERFCTKYSLYPSEKTYYVYNGLSCKTGRAGFDFNNRPIRLICVATLNDRKNQLGILQALKLLPAEYQDKVQLILVGDGPNRNVLEKKASSLKTKVQFIGSSNDVYKYLLLSDCFILFSKEEGLPISIIEAMSVGLPIIASDVDGIPEQVEDGKNGYLVSLSPIKLRDSIRKILDNRNLLPKMGKESYSLFLQKFTVEAMVKSYVDLFKEFDRR